MVWRRLFTFLEAAGVERALSFFSLDATVFLSGKGRRIPFYFSSDRYESWHLSGAEFESPPFSFFLGGIPISRRRVCPLDAQGDISLGGVVCPRLFRTGPMVYLSFSGGRPRLGFFFTVVFLGNCRGWWASFTFFFHFLLLLPCMFFFLRMAVMVDPFFLRMKTRVFLC